MFGEDIINGSNVTKMDAKRRIIIPKYTFIEPKENLIIRKSIITKNLLYINSEEEYEKIAEQFIKLIEDLYQDNKISYSDINKYRRYFFGECSEYLKTDKYNRGVIPERFITNFKLYPNIFMRGEKRTLELYPSNGIYYFKNNERILIK